MATIRSCTVCQKNHSSANSFMLTCKNCKRHWHHTCHLPLITEEELIVLVTASTRKLSSGTLESWLCRRCKNRTSTPIARGSARSSALPASRAGTSTPQRRNAHTASDNQVIIFIDPDAESQAAPRAPSSQQQSNANTRQGEVIELLDDSDDEVIEITPGAARKSVLSRSPKVQRTQTAAGSQLPSSSVEMRSIPTEQASRQSLVFSSTADPSEGRGLPTVISRNPSVSTQLRHLPLDIPHSHSPQPPSAGPNQPEPPVQTPLVLPAGSSTPDFRRLIADMRAQGRLGPSPADVATSRLLAYSAGRMSVDPYTDGSEDTPIADSPPDSDVEMTDQHEDTPLLVPEYEDPYDIEDMYGDEAPRRVKKEERQDGFIPPRKDMPKSVEAKQKTLSTRVRVREEADEFDDWTIVFNERAERVSERRAAGTLLPRKVSLHGKRRKDKLRDIQWAGNLAHTRVVSSSNQERWSSGVRALEHLFG